MTVESVRTPGIRFEPLPPPPPEPLPRLDVAGFVGFAARGPIDVPVAVEDVVRFHDLFGEDLPLAWDADRGEIVYAQLPSAVRAFFRNGGRRCWIVRVAEATDAETARFVLPGLLRVQTATGRIAAACAIARSPGAWADTLAVSTVLSQRPLDPAALTRQSGGWTIDVRAAGMAVKTGDLLQLTFAGGVVSYFAVRSAATARTSGGQVASLSLTGLDVTFRAASLDDLWPMSPGAPAPVVALLDGESDRQLAARPWIPPVQSPPNGAGAGFFIERGAAADIRPGAWVRFTRASPAREVLLQVDEIAGGQPGVSASPPGAQDMWLVKASRGWSPLGSTFVPPASPVAAALVMFDLVVRDGGGAVARASDLGFVSAHPRWWSALPDDVALFTPVERPRTNPVEALWREASRPRFPLAGRTTPVGAAQDDEGSPSAIDVPLGIPGVVREDFFQPPHLSARPAHERNGLGTFSPSVFLDPQLAASPTATLSDDAFFIRYQSPHPRPLRRAHALFDVAEVTIVATPDVVHRPWRLKTERQALLEPPRLDCPVPGENGRYDVSWSETTGAGYVLQESADPRFEHSRDTKSSTGRVADRGPVPRCQRVFYRVRATTADASSPWSNTEVVDPVGAAFNPRAIPRVDPPVLTMSGTTGGQYALQWTGAAPGRTFTLEVSADPTFLASRPLYEGPRNWFEIWTGEELSYYRVAVAEGGRRSAWSNTEFDRSRPPISGSQHRGSIGTAVPANLPESAQALDAAGISTLLDVHTAILRVCLARGDLFAVLALPSGTRGDDAVAYRVRLATRLDADEERLAAFGALYHPWPVVHDAAGGPLRLVSPDGTAAGVIARRAATAGGWVSPANQAWQGVAALEPPLTRSEADRLRQARMNLIAQQPAGFTSLSAWTLHGDIEFEELNQRLLAFLLRRLAARDGMAFAFQPNGYALRRQIEREFDRVLGDLYTRGAFAGLTRAEAYRVLTDDSLNTEASIDAGRCLVELQYAPSRPMAFLTIRLVQTGGGTVVAEEGTGG